MSELPAHLQTVVDAICERGCELTNELIDDLEAGKPRRETDQLSAADTRQVLQELKNIMRVYASK